MTFYTIVSNCFQMTGLIVSAYSNSRYIRVSYNRRITLRAIQIRTVDCRSIVVCPSIFLWCDKRGVYTAPHLGLGVFRLFFGKATWLE